MKLNTTTLILGVALTVVAGLFSSTIFGLTGTNANTQSALDTATSGYVTGHVVTTVTDSAGNIKEYRQSDNLITNQGENCVIKMLFGGSGGASVGNGDNTCVGAITSGFTVIAIGNNTSAAGNGNTTLGAEYTSAASSVPSLARKSATTVTITNSTAASGISQASAVIAATFTNQGGNGNTVTESGLFNTTDTATDGLFARQVFTAVTLNSGDSLTVQWTVNIGGTSTIDQSGP